MASVLTPESPVLIASNPEPLLPAIPERTPEMVLHALRSWNYWPEIQGVVGKEYGMFVEEYTRLLPEYQKFIGLVFLGYSPVGMFSRKIDEIWHAHVLSMHLYHQFCLSLHGEMIYHVPQFPKYDAGAICTTCRSCTNCSGGGQGGGGDDGGKYHGPAESGEMFFRAYVSAYGGVPLEIWDLSISEGLCVSKG